MNEDLDLNTILLYSIFVALINFLFIVSVCCIRK